MRIHHKLIAGGALLALMSGTALAHGEVHFGLSIGVPVAPVYVAPAPAYYPPPGYYAAPPAGYDAPPPPQVYYSAPAPAYYDAAPGYSLYYGPSYRQYRERRDWHHYRDRDHGDDDDD